MRFAKLSKKGVSVALALTLVAGAVATPVSKAEAASAKIPVSVYFYTAGGEWLAGDGSTAPKVSKTVTFKTGKKATVTLTVKVGKKAVTGAGVFVVDTYGILKKFKKSVKYSNISVKCDGKKVSGIKYQQGYFEKKENKNSWRLSFFNQWGAQGDTTKSNGTAKKYKFKKNLTVTCTILAK